MAPDAYESAHSPPAEEGFGSGVEEEKEEEEEEEGSSRRSSSSVPSCSRCSFLGICTYSCPLSLAVASLPEEYREVGLFLGDDFMVTPLVAGSHLFACLARGMLGSRVDTFSVNLQRLFEEITSGKCFVFSAVIGWTLDTIFASVYEAYWEMTSWKCSYSALAARQWIRVHTSVTELFEYTIFHVKVDTARAVRTRSVDIICRSRIRQSLVRCLKRALVCGYVFVDTECAFALRGVVLVFIAVATPSAPCRRSVCAGGGHVFVDKECAFALLVRCSWKSTSDP